jgi:hypothetical protein
MGKFKVFLKPSNSIVALTVATAAITFLHAYILTLNMLQDFRLMHKILYQGLYRDVQAKYLSTTSPFLR